MNQNYSLLACHLLFEWVKNLERNDLDFVLLKVQLVDFGRNFLIVVLLLEHWLVPVVVLVSHHHSEYSV